MSLSKTLESDELFSAVQDAIASESQDFSAIPQLINYDPANPADNDFIETIIGALSQLQDKQKFSSDLLNHTQIIKIKGAEIPEEMQIDLLLATVNSRNNHLLKFLSELGFNFGLSDKSGKDAFQGVAEQGIFKMKTELLHDDKARESSERDSIRIILKSGQTELKSEALINFVLFGVDNHLISLKEDLNRNMLEQGVRRFEKFFSPENKIRIQSILDKYQEAAPIEYLAARNEIRQTYNTFEEEPTTLQKVQTTENDPLGTFSTKRNSTSQPNDETKSRACSIS